MGQNFVRLAAEKDATQTTPPVRGHADQIAFLFLGDGDDLRVDIVALHQCGFQRDTGGPGQLLDPVKELSGFGLVPFYVRFRQDVFGGPVCAVRTSGECWLDMQRDNAGVAHFRQQHCFLNCFLGQRGTVGWNQDGVEHDCAPWDLRWA
jgi:hypothetical protein